MEQEKKICKNCKRAINANTLELHESHCARHIKLCSICEEPIPAKEMDQHYRENHAPKPCDQCGVEVSPDQLEEHLEQSCAEVKVECKYCELDIRRADYPEHTEQCGSRTDFCELCNQRVMLKEMNEHKAMKCGHMRAESPLGRYELEQMGLVEQDAGDSDSGDEFNYLPHGMGRPVTPPPSYERRHDDSMHVDPHWLQTVAEACGDDNLDALLAQNVFFENMRSVRSGDHHVTSEPVRSHDSRATTDESSEDEGDIVREKPSSALENQGDLDNRSLDENLARELATTNEQDDFYLAQRMQEREVMGHSKALYEEQRVKEIAREIEEEERDREMEGGTQEVRSKAGTIEHQEPGELDKQLEDSMVAKQLEINEMAKKLEDIRESHRLLARDLEEKEGEMDSLKLAAQLQQKDIAEGHQALWKRTPHSSQQHDEDLARTLQMDEDRRQYSHTHLEEEPRPKIPPTRRYVDDSLEKIPCQWCEELIPFEQVMLHQQSCYNNLYGGGTESGHGPHLSEDTFRRVETDDDSWQAEQFNVECQYCHVSVSINTLTTHEALCECNPDIHLKKVYDSQVAPSPSLRHQGHSLSSASTEPGVAASTTLLSVEKGPCEYCHQVIPLGQLIKHEAMCKFTRLKPSLSPPTSSQHSPAPPPSSPTLLQEASTATAAGRRSLAIKFPANDLHTTTHQGEEKDSAKSTRLDPITKQTNQVAIGSSSHGVAPLSSSLGREGLELNATKKRQSPSETFEPWSGVREPVKKAPRTTEMGGASVVPGMYSVASRGAGSISDKVVYSSSATGRAIYGANSKEREGNVLSSTGGRAPSLATTQKRESELKSNVSVESMGRGMRNLTLQSKPETEGSSLSYTTFTHKPPTSNSSAASRANSLQAGNSKLQITGTKVCENHATQSTGTHSNTTGTKSVSGSNYKVHSNARLKAQSVPASRTSSVGNSHVSTQSPATKSAITTSGRGRGRGRREQSNSSAVSHQSSRGNIVSQHTSSVGRGSQGSLSSRHSTSSRVGGTKSEPKLAHNTGNM